MQHEHMAREPGALGRAGRTKDSMPPKREPVALAVPQLATGLLPQAAPVLAATAATAGGGRPGTSARGGNSSRPDWIQRPSRPPNRRPWQSGAKGATDVATPTTKKFRMDDKDPIEWDEIAPAVQRILAEQCNVRTPEDWTVYGPESCTYCSRNDHRLWHCWKIFLSTQKGRKWADTILKKSPQMLEAIQAGLPIALVQYTGSPSLVAFVRAVDGLVASLTPDVVAHNRTLASCVYDHCLLLDEDDTMYRTDDGTYNVDSLTVDDLHECMECLLDDAQRTEGHGLVLIAQDHATPRE